MRPIRILIVDDTVGWGGSIVSTATLIRGLDRRRFQPIFVSAADRGLVEELVAEATLETPIVIARRPLPYPKLDRWKKRIDTLPGSLLRKVATLLLYGVRHIANIAYTARMLQLMWRHQIDIVQLNSGLGSDEVALAAMVLRRPRIAFLRWYGKMGGLQRRFFAPGIRRFVTVSRYIADQAIADGIDPLRVTVATPAVFVESVHDDDIAEVRNRHGLREGDSVVGIFGRIVPWKGQLQFLEAMEIVLARMPTAKVLLVGDAAAGDEEYVREARTFVEARGLESRVIFAGFRRDVATYYRVVDVVVHSSIEPEPSGRVIFEARAYGVPVVASPLGGPPEFIDHGIDGFIADPYYPEVVAGYVVRLLDDASLRRAMGEKGRARVLSRHGPEEYARTVEAVYADVVLGR